MKQALIPPPSPPGVIALLIAFSSFILPPSSVLKEEWVGRDSNPRKT